MSYVGIPIRHIQSISGQKSLSALKNYLGVREDDKIKAIKAILK